MLNHRDALILRVNELIPQTVDPLELTTVELDTLSEKWRELAPAISAEAEAIREEQAICSPE